MTKYKIALFDLDGTLSDSKVGITKSVQYALEKIGIIEPDLESLIHFIGPPLADQLIKTYGVSSEVAELGVEAYRERYVPIGLYEASLFDGTIEMLETLKSKKVIIALATSKPTEMAVEVLKHLGIFDYFDYVMGAELKGKRQTKDVVLSELISTMDAEVNKETALMIGDTYYDVDGATKVGLDAICVSYGFGDKKEMLEHGVKAIVDKAEDILEYF